jgi:glycosyltransferase involved in cell wall biosynthesis
LHARLGGDPRPYLLFVGRLNPIKGPDLLLAAAVLVREQLGDVRIVLAGPDEGMGAALQAQAAAAGLHDRVVLLGPVHGRVKVAAYRGARLLVVPSRQEAMSLVALEAGASGIPVLLTDACGFPEVERVGGGRVVPATPEGLADGLRSLLAEPAGLSQMGRRLQLLVLADYTWDRAARSYLELYRPLVAVTGNPLPTARGWT